jgi:AAT family amino acid transporter
MTENSAKPQALRRALTTAQISMIALGGTIGTGLFLGSGFAISVAGPGVLISYAVCAVIALLVMGSLAEMAAAQPASGSFGVYAEQYLSPFAGYLTRYMYWGGTTIGIGGEIAAVAIYMGYWFPHVPGWLWGAGFTVLLIAINMLQVSLYGTVEYFFSSLKIFAITAFILLALALVFRLPHGVATHNLTASPSFLPHGIGGAWKATTITLFGFFGLESIAVAAAESTAPKTSVVAAFRSTFLRLGLVYFGTLGVSLALVPWSQIAASSQRQSPFVRVLHAVRVPYAADLLNVVILIAALSAMNSLLYVTSRMMLSLAQAGYAPRSVAVLSRRGVPVRALLLSSMGAVIALAVQLAAPASAFLIMEAVSIFGAMFAWAAIFVTHLAFRRQYKAPLPFRLWGYPYTPLLGLALLLAIVVTTAFVPAFHLTLLCGLPFVAVMSLVYFVFLRGRAAPGQKAM